VIGGARPNANFFLLDGATNTDPTFNTQNLSPSPDAVMEFQVVTSSYTADMGGAGGGQINIVTRSGTSQYHGPFTNSCATAPSMPAPSSPWVSITWSRTILALLSAARFSVKISGHFSS
jgi:hypothetical protein